MSGGAECARADAGKTLSGAALDAAVRVARGSFTLDVALAVRPGEIVAVLGPNGAGKSTLLGVLAGVICPDDGHVRLGQRLLTSAGSLVPPERRGVGLMGQDPLLFPHLTALENVAFGQRAQGIPRRPARADAAHWLGRMGLAGFERRKPAQLSGGQRQRVALARALAAHPQLLLLDEPLGALDAQTAPEVRQLLGTHLRAVGVTTLLVTHDVLDAATLADKVLVLEEGAVVDFGPTATVLSAPHNAFTAALAGLNIVVGKVPGGADAASEATLHADSAGLRLHGIAAEALASNAPVTAVFSPAAVAVYLSPTATGSPRNSWPATITSLAPGPSAIRIHAAMDLAAAPPDRATASGDAPAAPSIAADITAAAVAELGLAPGVRVHLAVKATEVRIHARTARS